MNWTKQTELTYDYYECKTPVGLLTISNYNRDKYKLDLKIRKLNSEKTILLAIVSNPEKAKKKALTYLRATYQDLRSYLNDLPA